MAQHIGEGRRDWAAAVAAGPAPAKSAAQGAPAVPREPRRAAAAGQAPDAADATFRGTANELVLILHDRIPVDRLEVDGDRHVFDQLSAWDPAE